MAQREKGYPWLSFNSWSSWWLPISVTIIVIASSATIYRGYTMLSPDVSPDSLLGYIYAGAGTFFLLLAGLHFSLYRRSRKRTVGKIHAVLNWHVCWGVIGISLLFMHSFGNFNPRSGTYALYGLVALVICGFVGKLLDKCVPRLITAEVRKALTAQGEDRVEHISQRLQSIMQHNMQEDVRGFVAPANSLRSVPGIPGLQSAPFAGRSTATQERPVLQTSWDLAYISLAETPQELSRESAQHRFVPDKQSELAQPGALIPGAQEHMSALSDVQHALTHEAFYRYIIRYWRVLHIGLALLTTALTVWHLLYAAQLLLPTIFTP